MGIWSVIVAANVLLMVLSGGKADDYLPPGYEEVSTTEGRGFGSKEKCGEGAQDGLTICVPYHRCNGQTKTVIPERSESEINGFGVIDIRFGEETRPCEKALDVCCGTGKNNPTPVPDPDPGTTSTSTTLSPTLSPPVSPTSVPQRVPACGVRNVNGIDFKIKVAADKEAEYGEFPWMVAVLNKNRKPNENLAICGGSLLSPKVILTGAHCVYKYKAGDLKVRAGEWDTQTTDERLPYQERDVVDIILHERFHAKTLFNDVALLILERPYRKAQHIDTVCLPKQEQVVISSNCFTSGWGKDVFEQQGKYQVVLKKVELPIVPHDECQTKLRKTRLGVHFSLDNSFTCAGGKYGKDACTGDGGSPLVCPDPNNPKRYVQAGIVAWGIGCGENNIPGVYVDVSKFRDWIDENLQRLSITDETYN